MIKISSAILISFMTIASVAAKDLDKDCDPVTGESRLMQAMDESWSFDLKSLVGTYKVKQVTKGKVDSGATYVFKAKPQDDKKNSTVVFGTQYPVTYPDGPGIETNVDLALHKDAKGKLFSSSYGDVSKMKPLVPKKGTVKIENPNNYSNKYEIKILNDKEIEITRKHKRCAVEAHGCLVPGIGWSKTVFIIERVSAETK